MIALTFTAIVKARAMASSFKNIDALRISYLTEGVRISSER